jgi:hypothetical protein
MDETSKMKEKKFDFDSPLLLGRFPQGSQNSGVLCTSLKRQQKNTRRNTQMPHRRSGTPFGPQQTREMPYINVSFSSEEQRTY